MFQDSVPAGSYNDPFLSSVCVYTHTYTYIYMCICICICIYFFLSYLSHEIMAPLDECLWNGLNQPTSHPALMHQGLSFGYCLDVPGSPLTRKVTVGAAVSACATYGSWFWGAAALSATTDFVNFWEKDDLSTEHDSTCLHIFFPCAGSIKNVTRCQETVSIEVQLPQRG